MFSAVNVFKRQEYNVITRYKVALGRSTERPLRFHSAVGTNFSVSLCLCVRNGVERGGRGEGEARRYNRLTYYTSGKDSLAFGVDCDYLFSNETP